MSPSPVPDHVAAYAVALHHAGAGNWGDIAAVVAQAGLGSFTFHDLARAGTAWARRNVSPDAIRSLRAQARQRQGGRR